MSVTGFRNSETTGSAAGYVAPSCSSAYTTSSPVSPPTLTVSCSGGSATNYTFDTSATAQLTVTQASQATLTLTGTSSTAVYYDTQALGTTGGSGTGGVTYGTSTPATC